MRQVRWRGIRVAMIGVAIAALLINGVRVMPRVETLHDGYLLWRGVHRARADLAIVDHKGSANFLRAALNVRQCELQFALWRSEHAPDPIGGACLGALCLSVIALASACRVG